MKTCKTWDLISDVLTLFGSANIANVIEFKRRRLAATLWKNAVVFKSHSFNNLTLDFCCQHLSSIILKLATSINGSWCLILTTLISESSWGIGLERRASSSSSYSFRQEDAEEYLRNWHRLTHFFTWLNLSHNEEKDKQPSIQRLVTTLRRWPSSWH